MTSVRGAMAWSRRIGTKPPARQAPREDPPWETVRDRRRQILTGRPTNTSFPGVKRSEVPALRREAILAACFHEVARRGVAGATVGAVAKRAGVAHGAVHYYFPGGKDALVLGAIDWAAARHLARVGRAL